MMELLDELRRTKGECAKHHKDLEFFCPACSQFTPMCSLCIYEHNQERHFKGNLHMKDMASERLTNIAKRREKMTAELSDALSRGTAEEFPRRYASLQTRFSQKAKAIQDFVDAKRALADRAKEHCELLSRIVSEFRNTMQTAIKESVEAETRAWQLLEGHKYCSTLITVLERDNAPTVSGVNYERIAKLEKETGEEIRELERIVAGMDVSMLENPEPYVNAMAEAQRLKGSLLLPQHVDEVQSEKSRSSQLEG